jgi:phosphoenolpyruvate synthase/pyruvate phosphate dikinase
MSTSLQSDNPHTSLVAPLSFFARGSIAFAGGKRANLGELIRAGFQVPPGFVITTAAYNLLRTRSGLQ